MLTRSSSDSNLNFNPEIDLTLRALHREQKQRRENQFNRMAQPERRTLGDFAMPDISCSFGGIVAPAIANNNLRLSQVSFKWCKIINLEAYKEKILMLTF